MRRLREVVLGCVTLVGGWGATALAEDARPSAEPLELRLVDVSDLTAGAAEFLPEQLGIVPVDCVNDERNPLFGGEGEEYTKPYGSSVDIIDLAKNAAGPAGAWEREGVQISALGERFLLLRAPRSLADAVEAFVLERVRESLATVTVDCAVLAGDPAAAADGGVAAAVARGALVPLGSARACGALSERIVGRQGGQTAYLQDYDVEVAESTSVGDPIVNVISDGLNLDTRVSPVSPERLLVAVQAKWCRRLPARTAVTKQSGSIEIMTCDTRTSNALVDVRPGVWTTLPATGAGDEGVVFAVRVIVRPYDVEPVTSPALVGPSAPPAGGTLALRTFPVRDLANKVYGRRGRSIDLWPSNFTPPEPPELAEPQELFPTDMLVQVLKVLVGDERTSSWDEGTSLDLKGGVLLVRNRPAVLDRVGDILDRLRARFIRTTRVRAVVVTMPAASLPEYWMGLDEAALLADGGAALLARDGARVVDRASLRLFSGERGAAVGGREHTYVSDYNVEVAEKASIGNPVTRTAFVGTSFDVWAHATGRGGGVTLDVRLDRSTDRGSRQVPTPHGDVECPSHGVMRMHGFTVLRNGSTRLLCANLEGSELTLVLVSASAE